jgi:homospermidine synthase
MDIQSRKIIILGVGAVGKCVSYYLPEWFNIDYKKLFLIDKDASVAEFPSVVHLLKQGATFKEYKILSTNVQNLFEKTLKLSKGDIVIDVTTRTDTTKIITLCRKNQLIYLNTDIYDEIPTSIKPVICPLDFAISTTHYNIENIIQKTQHHGNITSILECGMNPGLISIFVKQGLRDIAKYVLQHKQNKSLKIALRNKDYYNIAKILKIRVIHCSEIDTQIPDVKQNKDLLVNTWSCIGLVDEGCEPCEISMGTHEKIIPVDPKFVNDSIPQVAIINKDGIKTRFKSYVPIFKNKVEKIVEFKEIKGVSVHHGEGISLNMFISKDEYAPTMQYVYRLSPLTDKIAKTNSRSQLVNYTLQDKWRVMNMYEDKLNGTDNVGACFILETNPINADDKNPWGWWTGTMLDTDYTKNVLKDNYFGPTVIQVMAGILSGLCWIIDNPESGVIFAEEMDEGYIIAKAKKYLGHIYSGPITGVKIAGYTINDLMVTNRDRKHTKYEII